MRTLALVVLCLVVVPAGVFAWAASSRSGRDWTVAEAKARLQSLGYPHVRVVAAPRPREVPASLRPLVPSIRGAVVAQQAGGAAVVIVMTNAGAAYRIENATRTSAQRSGVRLAVVSNVLLEAVSFGKPSRLPQLVAAFER